MERSTNPRTHKQAVVDAAARCLGPAGRSGPCGAGVGVQKGSEQRPEPPAPARNCPTAVPQVPEQYVGAIVELFAQRKGEMVDLIPRSVSGSGGFGWLMGAGPKREAERCWASSPTQGNLRHA